MPTENSNFFKYVVETKIKIEKLEEDIQNQITAKAEQIRAAGNENPNLDQWRIEMAHLQSRNVTEPEDALHLLCAGIEKKRVQQEFSNATPTRSSKTSKEKNGHDFFYRVRNK
jgi:hypothetical protein